MGVTEKLQDSLERQRVHLTRTIAFSRADTYQLKVIIKQRSA